MQQVAASHAAATASGSTRCTSPRERGMAPETGWRAAGSRTRDSADATPIARQGARSYQMRAARTRRSPANGFERLPNLLLGERGNFLSASQDREPAGHVDFVVSACGLDLDPA